MNPIAVCPEDIEKHLRVLTQDIGVRLAGLSGERQAADYIAEQMRRFGADVSMEEFPVRERAVTEEILELRVGGTWRRIPCSLLSNAPGTAGRMVEAPIALLDAQTGYQRNDLSFLSGKAVLHLGTQIETADYYRRLMAAGPAFLMFIDVRYPGNVVTADGMFPAYVHKFGAVPTVSVAYMDAWDLQTAGADAARLRVSGGMRGSTSQNVVGVLPGTDPDAGVIVLGAHHDTQADSVGADDNGTGVSAIIELTGALAAAPRKRTLRLISFGAEEQLSVGSSAYVRRHREELARSGRFMFNFDSFGSHLGWTDLECSDVACAAYFEGYLNARDLYVRVLTRLCPYADHFPFLAAGMAAVYIGRDNCAAGRFFHHRPDDDLSRVSCPLTALTAGAVGDGVVGLIGPGEMPFDTSVPEPLQGRAATMWEELFGGWRGFSEGEG